MQYSSIHSTARRVVFHCWLVVLSLTADEAIRIRSVAAFLAVAPFCSSLIAQTPHTATLTWTWSQGDGPVATGFNVKRSTTT